MRLLLSLLLFSVLCASGYGRDIARPILDSELMSILQECQSLREQLKTSEDSLAGSVLKLAELEQALSEQQSRIEDLLARSQSLEGNLVLSEEALATLRDQLEASKRSFEKYRNEVESEQMKTAALWAAGGVLVGVVVGLLF